MGFSNEDNCCQSQEYRKSIKDMVSKGILSIRFLQVCHAQTTFIPEWIFSSFHFFSQNRARKLGVWLIYECGLYTSFCSSWCQSFDWILIIPVPNDLNSILFLFLSKVQHSVELVILAMFSFCYQVYVELEAIGAASAESRVRRILAVSSVILWFKLVYCIWQSVHG